MNASDYPREIEHISGGVVEIKMSPLEMDLCRRECLFAGDPPCFELPAKTSDWPNGEPVIACDKCKRD